ncbi:Chaperone protein DnaJ [Candidatus Hodgkinia cicadicola]|nr:Chaperone protein DnaJ [Candidatus Hodgkinia cicadicola]
MKSPYDILGINKSASAADIRLAFKQLALKHHPDKNPNDSEANKRFKEINEAYTLLKDPKKRAQYDKHGGGDEFASHPFEDFFGGRPFDTHFGAPFGTKLNKTRGRHIRLNCALSLYQLWVGASFNFSITTKVECETCKCVGRVKRNKRVKCRECNGKGTTRIRQGIVMFEQTCSACRGSGTSATERCKKCGSEGRLVGKRSVQFNVRPGTAINTVFKLEGLGEAGIKGARAGGLYVRISANPHQFYSVYGADLFCTLAASSETISFGGRLEFNTVVGTPLTLIVPSSTPADSLFVLRQRGLPCLQGGFGNLHIKLSVYSVRHNGQTHVLKFSKRTLQSLLDLAIRLNKVWTDRAHLA